MGMAETHTGTDSHATHEGGHVSWKFYTVIGLVLAIITAVEVAVFYIEALSPVLIPVLVTLSVTKFVLVVLFFMHLKYDHAIFGRVFWAPLLLAVLVVIGMILLFHVLPTFGKFA
jgi:cytochrome c oxidase subunit 4